MGYILLEGGAEFKGAVAMADRRAMALAGGRDARISIIPAAAAPDNNHRRAGTNAENWFQRLGARRVQAVPLIDRESAGQRVLAEALSNSSLIFILGGFAGYLADTLRNSASWDAMREAQHKGGVIAGSSAGAMVLCEHFFDPIKKAVTMGLNLISGVCIVPHHDTFGAGWVGTLQREIPDTIIIGIDEGTGMIDEGGKKPWHVYGGGAVTIYRKHRTHKYSTNQHFALR